MGSVRPPPSSGPPKRPPPPTYPRGEELLIAKKNKLPLELIMAGEKQGGWGRSMRGAELACQKFQKSPDCAHMRLDLQAHLSLASKARKLQAQNIMALSDDELTEIIDAMLKARATFHRSTNFLLVQRRAQKLTQGMLQDNAKFSPGDIKRLIVVMDPTSSEVKFDPKDPVLAALNDAECSNKTGHFEHIVLKGFLVSLLSAGESKVQFVRDFAHEVLDHFGQINMLNLAGPEASCFSDLLEIARALTGLCSPDGFAKCMQYSADLLAVKGAFGALVSGSLVALVAQALMDCKYYKDMIDTFMKASPALSVVMPLIDARMSELQDVANMPESLRNAAELVTSHESTVPEGTFEAHNNLLEAKAAEYHNMLMVEIKGLKDKPCEKASKALNDKLTEWSATSQELALAFPMASWVHDLSEEIAAELRNMNELNFNAELKSALESIKKVFETQKALPDGAQVSALKSVLDRASTSAHFGDDEMQAAITSFFDQFEALYATAFGNKDWSEIVKVASELCGFIADKNNLVKYRVELLSACIKLRRSVDGAKSIASGHSWRNSAVEVLQGKDLVEKLVNKLPPGDKDMDKELLEQVKKGAAETIGVADKYIGDLLEAVKAT